MRTASLGSGRNSHSTATVVVPWRARPRFWWQSQQQELHCKTLCWCAVHKECVSRPPCIVTSLWAVDESRNHVSLAHWRREAQAFINGDDLRDYESGRCAKVKQRRSFDVPVTPTRSSRPSTRLYPAFFNERQYGRTKNVQCRQIITVHRESM